MQARVRACMRALRLPACVCVCMWVRVQRSCAEVAVVLSSPDLGFSLHVLSVSLSLSLSLANLPLEYPMGPFYTGKFCDRARETDMASAQAKRAREGASCMHEREQE